MEIDMIDQEKTIELAVTTAFFRSDFDNQTDPCEVDDQDAWEYIATKAYEYLRWVGLDASAIHVDKYVIAQLIWGMSAADLDEELR
jgi:hypothetical protein